MNGDAPDLDDDDVTVTVESGLYVATHDETGVSSQGQTEVEARANLAEAVSSYLEGTAESDDDWM